MSNKSLQNRQNYYKHLTSRNNNPLFSCFTEQIPEENKKTWFLDKLNLQIEFTKPKYRLYLRTLQIEILSNEKLCFWQILLMSTDCLPPKFKIEALMKLSLMAVAINETQITDCKK
jgi:hypothetical protein